MERFNRTVLDEFFRPAMRTRFYEPARPGSVEALQEDLNWWFEFYNHERPRLGYRNQGKRAIDTVMEFVQKCA